MLFKYGNICPYIMSYGKYTYGKPTIHWGNKAAKLVVGNFVKYCRYGGATAPPIYSYLSLPNIFTRLTAYNHAPFKYHI